MDNETIRTIFTCCATLGAVIITQLFTYLNSKSNKTDSIYKQQYDKIFSPIHKLLFFSEKSPSEYMDIIYKIISDNYNLASETLIDEFMKCYRNKDGLSCEFCNTIRLGYDMLRNKLGYTKLKMGKEEKDNAKRILSNSKATFSTLNIFLFLINLAACTILLVYVAISLINNEFKFVFLQQNIFILIILGVQFLSICFLGGRIFK